MSGAESGRHPGAVDPGAAAGRVAFLRSQDGLRLAARIFDAPGSRATPVLCLPGLSRNSRDFTALAEFLSRHAERPRKVVALDYRGRGLSDPDPDWRNYTPGLEAQDVLAAAAALGLEQAIVVGTSRGGIIAMLLGAQRPGLLAGVVLNDIGPAIEPSGLARIKGYLSARREVRNWAEAVAAVQENAGGQFPALSNEDWRAYAEAYFAPTAEGMLAPQFDSHLVRSVQALGGSDPVPSLWPQFGSLRRVPVLAVRGEFSDILSASTLSEMEERHPSLERLVVSGQGHAPLLRDDATLRAISAWMERCDPRPG